MLKKAASGVLASLRGSTYRSVRLAPSLAAALLDGLFEHPAGAFYFFSEGIVHSSPATPKWVFRSLPGMSRGPQFFWSRPSVFLLALLLVGALAACSSTSKPTYFPGYPVGFVERGVASWYGPGFHGNKTANGERYDMHQLTAAHRTLPLGSIALVRSTSTGRQVTVRINDRGPFARGRVLDLSLAGAQALGMTGTGTDQIELRVVGYQGRAANMGVLRVQVGSFSDQQNALNLLERTKHFYSGGRVQTVDLSEGKRYRVQIGQFSTETQAEAAASRLESSLGLSAFVFRDDAP
jgi:rare lipoprotein A